MCNFVFRLVPLQSSTRLYSISYAYMYQDFEFLTKDSLKSHNPVQSMCFI